ncbi:MAG: glycoside hydrolase family 31 protein [Thermoleophilaceae bacterium]|nr:glycoside hydrolase family 31 protein [Thermoleophilaceae bacterium]
MGRPGPIGVVALAIALATTAPAGAAVHIGGQRIVVDAGGAAAVVERSPLRISFRDGGGRAVLAQVENRLPGPLVEPPTVDPEPGGVDLLPESTLYAPLTFSVGEERIEQFPGPGPLVGDLMQAERSGVQYAARAVVAARRTGPGVRLALSTGDPSGRRLIVTIRPQGREAIRVSARPTPSAGVSVVADSFAAGREEAFHGFGGRHNEIDQRGWALESFLNQTNLSGEAPAGAPGPPDRYMAPNGPTGAYFVQSSFVSSRPYGFLSLRDELTRWRMASDRPDAWQVAASAPALDYVVAPGRAPRAIRTITRLTGRQRVPPRWALRPQLDRLVRFPAQSPATYLSEVRRDLEAIKRHRLPVGSYRIEAWEFIPRPTLRRLIARFRASGIRVLLYFRAFVGRDEIGTDRPELLDEAVRRGYVARRADGQPYVFQSNFFTDAAMIDFTDPAALRWWTRRIHEALELGADGFMQDFGEQVPLDMHFADGSTGRTMHNRLPVLFHRATRRAIDSYRAAHPRRGEAFFFTRSGYSGLPGSVRYENATWPGDEPTDWSRSAGLAAQAPDMLNRGIGGAYGFGTDIGGYFDVGRTPTTKELFLRWAEWAALTPIFRLHGSVAAGTHTPWTYDAETVRIYRRLSRLHEAAVPLIARLWRRAARTGMPIARPLWLEVPGDRRAGRQDQEWMLGPNVLVAPVVEEGARSRQVYLPRGCWVEPETGRHRRGPASPRVAAPLGRLPYFFRCGMRPWAAARAAS